MAHWFDDLARSVARSSIVGAFREVAQGRGNGFVLIQPPDIVAIQHGPCGARRSGSDLTRTFATTASTADGQLLTFTTRTVRNLAQDRIDTRTLVKRGATMVFELLSEQTLGGPMFVTLHFGTVFAGLREIRGRIVEGRLEGMIDGRPWAPFALAATGLEGAAMPALPGSEEAALAEAAVRPGLLAELRDIANKGQRELPACLPYPNRLMPFAESSFPGCDDCQNGCEQIEVNCPLEAVKKAADDCPVWAIPFCVFYYGAACLQRAADCYHGCITPPGPCCPKRCQRDGIATCCAAAGLCCGGQCCPDGAYCADATHDLCCSPNSGPACGGRCCQPGFKCANLFREFCCAEDAGDYCPKVWNEEQWTDRCCPPNDVCADPAKGVCCPRGHGPVCGEACCRPGEVCRHGVCCRPHQLCGNGERAVCCFGECRNGECCALPDHYCGDVCCPGFGPCCSLHGEPVCCGSFEQCLPSGCCPNDQVCGRICCPMGQRCDDFEAEVCAACPEEQIACVGRYDKAGRPRSICCPANVDCCGDVCCQFGELCCPLGTLPAECRPSYHCVH